MRRLEVRLGTGVTLLCATLAHASGPADRCEATKLAVAGGYANCRLKADATAVKKGTPVDYGRCDAVYVANGDEPRRRPVACPTQGDAGGMRSQLSADAARVALALRGRRFVGRMATGR